MPSSEDVTEASGHHQFTEPSESCIVHKSHCRHVSSRFLVVIKSLHRSIHSPRLYIISLVSIIPTSTREGKHNWSSNHISSPVIAWTISFVLLQAHTWDIISSNIYRLTSGTSKCALSSHKLVHTLRHVVIPMFEFLQGSIQHGIPSAFFIFLLRFPIYKFTKKGT